jgi:CHASE3 domain sensor protein
MIYKWICSNGVIFGGGKGVLYSRQHRGAFENDFLNEFPKTIENIPQIVARIKVWVEKSKERKVDSDIIQTMIDRMKKEGYATIPVAAKIIDLIPKYGETRWGVAQAIGEIAQEYSIDTRERLEMYAGEIIMAS